MRILTAELKNYESFRVNNIRRLLITMTSVIQVILGRNGSGKSRLINELTPLPSDAADYTKEGGKIITIEHRGEIYTISSRFDPKPQHSFKRGEEELNPGRTAFVQKQLCKQYFHVTPESHALMTGRIRFSTMNPADRRTWMTRLSDVNYDYALAAYQGLKAKHNEISGALKRTKSRLTEETAKLITAEEQNRIEKEVDVLHEQLTMLSDQRAPVTTPVTTIEGNIQIVSEELITLSKKLFNIKFEAPYGINPLKMKQRNDWGELTPLYFTSVGQVEEVIVQYKEMVTVKETLINHSYQEHQKLKETVKILLKTGEDGVEVLKKKLEDHRNERNRVLETRLLKIEGIPAKSGLAALESVRNVLNHVFETIPVNDEQQYSSAKMTIVETKLADLKEKEYRFKGEIEKIRAKQIHLESHKDQKAIDCPKCHYTWVEGYSEQEYQGVLKRLETAGEFMAAIGKEIESTRVDLVTIQHYATLHKDYHQCVQHWPVLRPFWDHLAYHHTLTDSPRSGLILIERLGQDLLIEQQAEEIENKITETIQLITSSEMVGDANLKEVQEKLLQLEIQIEEYTRDLTTLQNIVKECSQYRGRLLESEQLRKSIEDKLSSLNSLTVEGVEMLRRDTVNHCIRQLQLSLAKKEEVLQSIRLQNGIFQDIEKQIGILTLEEESMRHLVRELSPTDGLIAEGLLGFMSNFTKRMNGLIKRIWTYSLIIEPCKPDATGGADLDYRFPLQVGDYGNPLKDISEGSTGIKEVIDLAFKVTAMRYLGLEESPLVLDEFGASFDVEHRVSASNAIRELIDHQSFPQLFMVSHYVEGYGSLVEREICVLDKQNIICPDEYNQHVTIE